MYHFGKNNESNKRHHYACREQGIKTSHRCVGLHIMTWSIWLTLTHLYSGADLLGDLLTPDTRKNLPIVADTLFHIMVRPNF